jgi:hypothetical protein
MQKEKLDYLSIQTSKDVWEALLKLNPINEDDYVLEPFAGENSLYDLIQTNKDWAEITKGRDIFQYDFENSKATVVYTNPPFKCDIPNKKGEMKYKNSCYFFLEFFMQKLKKLNKIGFLINAKSFGSLTPNRLTKLKKLGFEITSITVLNLSYWWGTYYFVVFEKEPTNKLVKVISKTFTEKFK